MEFQISGCEEFQHFRMQDPETLTDLEWAFQFLYLQGLSFSGQVTNRPIGI
ncbi:hypothetical protein [Bartonella quintana]|uniref:hypothetical protein n=1 Tax=Bartonella quintana TaxID=803 RepID=UPI001FCE8A67|nr:hypothetical protein [Bartonella quintana]